MDEHDAEPGMYDDMLSSYYHKTRAVSKSRLDTLASGSPKHYWEKYLNPDHEEEESSPTLVLGDAIHGAVLEPDTFDARYVRVPDGAPQRPSSRQVNAKKPSPDTTAAIRWWSDFNADCVGKKVVTAEQHEIALKCRDAIHTHPTAAALFTGGIAERSYFARDPQTGLLIKVRPDYESLGAGMIVDLKSTLSASEVEFGRSAENFRYHVQGAIYSDVVKWHYGGEAIEHFVFVAVEKAPPFAVGIYYMEPEDFEDGFTEYSEDLDVLARCFEANEWPDYAAIESKPHKRPSWAASKRRRAEIARKNRSY